MKSGVAAGAIAGIIAGIVAVLYLELLVNMGPLAMYYVADPVILMKWAATHIGLNVFWGAVMGAVFAKVYNVVPNKGAMKGLIFSLIMWIFVNVYMVTFNTLSLGMPVTMSGILLISVGLLVRIVYGPILGVLYKK
ncbi:MAG: hypothetical protein NWF08_08640 [Candidatus Bathyarchaeota archaeon]|nr:hypothetical protein [Candidatus Bathyarchaeota archaeon]